MKNWNVDVATNFKEDTVEVSFDFPYDESTQVFNLAPEKALLLAQLLIEKSLNLIEKEEKSNGGPGRVRES